MSGRSVLKLFSCFLLFSLIAGSFTQLYFTDQIKKQQHAIVTVQGLLDLSDEFSANLGSVQQDFRSYALKREPGALKTLVKYQGVVLKTLKAKAALSAEDPELQQLLAKINSTYQMQNGVINAYIAVHPNNIVAEESIKTLEKSEAGMGMVWTQLFEYRKLLKDRIKSINTDIANLSEKSYNVTIWTLLSLFLVVVILGGAYLRRKQAKSIHKDELSNKSMLMQALLRHTSTCMVIMDKKGKILYANRAFEEFIGVKERELLGKTFTELTMREGIDYENKAIRIDINYPYSEIEEKVVCDGEVLHFFTRKFPIKNDKGEIVASGLISRNITQRIIYEEGLKKSRQEAENAKLTQEQFMANISHEIRTPMNGIIGMTDLLAATTLSQMQHEYVSIINQSSKNLMVLINDILDFSKIEAGKLELEKISFKIADVLNQVISTMNSRAQEKNLPLNLHIDHTVPAGVLGDPLRLYQIMSNILSNAIKFTAAGSVDIHVSAQSQNSGSVTLRFQVTDTGIGIPEERIGYIFQSFTQTSLDITRKFGGTGLGLAIVKQLVELYNGNISVSSEVGKGSTFIVEIPFNTVIIANRTLEEDAKFELLKDKKILVVEDNLINQKVIIKTLENSGMKAVLCDNGFSALELLKTEQFDLIIMDIQMPEIDGRETTLRIRKELGLNTPIIAMTASVLADEREKCKAVGMNEYISKPFVKEDVLEKMLLFI